MTTSLLLDTCAVIWMAEARTLTVEATEAIASAYRQSEAIGVSAITAWELGQLSAKGRLPSAIPPLALFRRFVDAPGVELRPLDPEILIDSSFLPGSFHKDPADRIIVATARAHGLTIVTADEAILAYADTGHVRAIAC